MGTYANESALSSVISSYEKLLASADPRVEDLLLMQSPVPIVTICLTYIYFVLSLGPKLMQDRKPFNLRYVLIIYNLGQTIFSAVCFYLAVEHWLKNYGWGLRCYPINYHSNTPEELWGIKLCHAYFLSKISELCDTIFFVLKKKNKHVSLLHVFHHAAMPFSVWVGVKYHPGGNLAFFGLPNLFVHIFMYMYYMVAAMGPQYQKYIWWKRHITEMQLAQFGLVMLYMLYVSFTCNLNMRLVTWILCLDVAFVILFLDFYWKAYKKKQFIRDAAAASKEIEMSNGKVHFETNGNSKTETDRTNGHVKHEITQSKATANGYQNGLEKKNL